MSSNKSVDIQISNAVDDEIIIIDLTSNKETKNEEALITGEEKEPQSLLISFDSPESVPILESVGISDEVVSFTAQQDLPSNINFESFEVRPRDPVPALNIPITAAPLKEEAVTPIVANQELRSFFTQNEIRANNIEVIDLRGQTDSTQFTLLNEDADDSGLAAATTLEAETITTTASSSIITSQTTRTTTATTFETTATPPEQSTSTELPQVEFINRNALDD